MAKKKDHEPLQRWTPPAETFSNSNIQQSSNTSNVKYERDESKASRSGGNSLFNAAKRFLTANDDAAEMTYGVYNPTAKQRSTLGNVVAAGGRSWRAGQRNALAALLDPTDDGSATDAEMMFYTPGAKQTLSEMENNPLANWLKKQRGAATEKLSKSADELSAEAQEAEETAKDGKSKVSKLLIDAGIAGVQLGLDVGVGAATGTGTLSMGTRTFGQSYKEATGAGANQQQAFNYAASAAGVEMLTEKIFDVAKLFGGGAADDAIEKAVGKWAKTDAGKTALRSFFAAATEGGEEVASDLVNPLIREFYQSGAAKEAFFTKEGLKNLASDAGHDAIIGAMLGGLGNVANVGNNAQKNNLIRQREAVEAAQAEAQRMEEFNQRQQRQRDYFAGNTMQTGTADADAAVVLNRNARGRGEAAMIAEVIKASNVDPDTALRNMQAYEAQQNAAQAPQQAPQQPQATQPIQQPTQPQNAVQAMPEPQTAQTDYESDYEFELPENYEQINKIVQKMGTKRNRKKVNGYSTFVSRDLQKQGATIVVKRPDGTKIKERIEGGEFWTNDQLNYRAASIIYDDMQASGNVPAAPAPAQQMPEQMTVMPQAEQQAQPAQQPTLPGFEQQTQQTQPEPVSANNAQTEQPANPVTPESSVGAAQQGYDPYSAWQNQSSEFHPDSANGVRQADLPKENLQGQKTMRGGRTVMEAEATPENRVREIEQLYVDGHLAYVPVNNDQLAADATASIERNGWDRALQDWTVAVRSGQSSPQLVAMGATLLNNAGNSNASAEAYLNLVQDYVNLTHGTAQALQATKILQSLTPQSVVYMMGRTERQMNDQLNNTRRGRRENRRNREDAEREVQEITRQRDDALNLIREIGEAFHGEQDGETLTWQQQLSQELEQHVLDSQNANRPTRTPSGTIMIRDLYRFADDLIQRPERANRPRRTAMDRIADYFANRAEYDQAWEQAQQAAMEQYADDPDAMARMQPFLNSGVNTNNGNASRTALSAVAEAVAAEEISRRSAAMRYQYGDMASLTNQIVNRITQTVPIENDADVYEIYNAVSEYLQDNLTRRNANGDLVNGDRMMPEMRRSLREFGLRMSDIIREGAETKGQVADLIAQDMIQRFGVSEDGAQEFANHVVNAFTMEVASRSESALESMFRERSRSQPRSFGEKLAELSNMGAFTNPDFANLATQKMTGDSSLTVSLNPELVQEYLDAETDAERDDIMTEIQKDLARQLPTSWMEKWNALRYLNMLGNLKTQGRNIVGNTTMMLTAKAKRETLAAMEHLASAVTGGKYERMTSFVVSPELYAAARRDFRNVQKAALGEAKYGDAGGVSKNQFMRETNEYKRIFNSRVLEAYRKATKWSMEQGDVIFSRATYANALAGYLKAHGITAEEFANNPNSDVIDKGRMYAIKEAQEATFRDSNQFSDWVSKIGRRPDTPWFGRLAAEGIAPFRKTPANVLVRAEEYSPLGLVNSLVKTFQARNVDSEVTAQDAMNSWAKTLTGSAICAAGFLLAKAGMLHGSNDDDDRQSSFDSLTGHQEYSIEINGKSYTIDTFSPTSMPMLVGAAFYDLMEEDGFNIKGIENAITSLADPMINMSMLSGVNDAISNVQFADNNLIQLAINSGVGYLTQGLTNTMLGQLERTLEDNRMSTFTDENSNLPNFLQRQLGKASAKTPIWDYNQSEYLDNWGRTQSNGNWLERAFNNFINPVYTSEISTDPTDKMLSSLAEETGDTAIYPNSMYDIPDIKFDGEKGKLTQKQKESYQKVYGKEYKTLVNDLRQSPEFQSLTSAEKTAALSKLEEYAVNAGKNAIGADTSETNWATASEGSVAQNAVYNAQYQAVRNAAKQTTGKDSPSDGEVVSALSSRGLDYDTTVKIMSQFMEKSTIQKYENAYADGYDFGTSAAFSGAYYEKSYDFGTTDAGNPKQRGKDGTIAWAQENLGLTYSQSLMLYNYLIKR